MENNAVSEVAMDAINTLLKKEIHTYKTPSVNYLFFDQKQIIHQFSYGLKDVLNNRQTDIHTMHHASAITTTVTAIAILQLVEQGVLDIHKPINHYLHDFPYPPEITINHILTHTSGIPSPNQKYWTHPISQHNDFDRNMFFTNLYKKYVIPKCLPNEKLVYSHLGYNLLGELIETVSGLKYEEYIRQNVFDRLEVERTEIGFETSYGSSYAKGYQKKLSFATLKTILAGKRHLFSTNEQRWFPFNELYANSTSSMGLISSPYALTAFVQELLKPESRLLSPISLKLLLTENKTNNGKPTNMSIAWAKGELNKQQYFTQAGFGNGYYSEIRLYPQLGLGSVIMMNRTGTKDERLLNKTDIHFITPKLSI